MEAQYKLNQKLDPKNGPQWGQRPPEDV